MNTPAADVLPTPLRQRLQDWGHLAATWLGVAAFLVGLVSTSITAAASHTLGPASSVLLIVGGVITKASQAIDSANNALKG